MKKANGITIDRHFTQKNNNVYDQYTYNTRSSIIKNPNGETIFEMNDVEVPNSWSQVATDILAQKYFRKAGVPQEDGSLGSENSIKQVAHRLADCWRHWGEKHNYFKTKEDGKAFYDEMAYMILGQMAAPNSPQWFNTGLHNTYGIEGKAQGHYYVDPKTEKVKRSANAYERPQPHACFILSVEDDLVNEGGIMDLWTREARIFKYGSGVGTNFSTIRGAGETLSGGGTSSGLMSFLLIGDRAAGAIKSGGTTRRAAKMVCLDLDHPEILDFINWKQKEEQKVKALIDAGYAADYEGEAYRTVAGQNSNNSVRIPNSFFKALEQDENWNLVARTDGSTMQSIPAKDLWDQIGKAAWQCADPGVQYDSTINDWHTCPEGGRINASNPCSEYMFLDNTACNLASLNLRKFYNEDTLTFDVKAFEHACRLWTIVLEISVLMAQFPSEEVAQLSYQYRTLGLGYANLGSVLMVSGIPYDSDKARAMAGAITSIMTGTAYKTSAELAKALGAFNQYEKNKTPMLRVMRNHRAAAYNNTAAYENLGIQPMGIDDKTCPDYLLQAARNAWDDAVEMGEQYGYRNAQATVLAPTGTIGLVMDCDTTGVEPDFALVKFKKLSGGGYFKIINQSIPKTLKNLRYTDAQITDIVDYAKGKGSIMGAPFINPDTLLNKGLTLEDIAKVDEACTGTFEIGYAFSSWVLGTETMNRLGFNEKQFLHPAFDLLFELGFEEAAVEAANNYVCGTMTIEGAPHLKETHYPIFDCANKCGKIGKRYISAGGHIKMMAAAQSFISGAISKTINLPNEATVEEITDAYYLSWKLGVKANALYRDGCKLSQPLSNKSDKKKFKIGKDGVPVSQQIKPIEEPLQSIDINVKNGNSSLKEYETLTPLTPEKVLDLCKKYINESDDTLFMRELSTIIEKKKLPAKRSGFTMKGKIDGQSIFLTTGEYKDGTLGEIFVEMHKEGATLKGLLNCFAVAVSVGLQYGVPLEEYVSKFSFTRFEPAGFVDHPYIKNANSVVDYIFRILAYEYCGRTDLVHAEDLTDHPSQMDKKELFENALKKNGLTTNGQHGSNKQTAVSPNGKSSTHQTTATATKPATNNNLSEHAKDMHGDAPACSTCGHITIRNGTCYKCLNCGSTSGCS